MCWEIDNFVIKSDIFRWFFICKNILKKISCYHENYFRYFMFGKYNGLGTSHFTVPQVFDGVCIQWLLRYGKV
jgi:hypothetical protein